MVSDPKLCGEFITKLERFMDATHDERKRHTECNYQEYEQAKFDLHKFIAMHFELK